MRAWIPLFFTLLFANTLVGGVEEPDDQSPSDEATATTYKVEAADLRVRLNLSGVFESVEASEVKADMKQLSSLTIDRALASGTVVRKGQPIIWFETEKMDQQLREAQYSLRLAELALRESELGMKQLQQTQELDRELAERTMNIAKQNYDNFVKTDHERQKLSAEFSLKGSRASLANALEELEQLEKMYKEDELTEESEEIVLKRARQAAESAKFRLDGTEINTQRSLEQVIPQELERQREALARQELAHDRAIKTLEFARQRAAVELDRQKTGYAKQESDLAELRADRKRLVLLSPIDGVVYYGQLARGRLGDGKQSPKLSKGSAVSGGQVLMTIVNANALQIRLDLEEKHLQLISSGDKGFASPTAFPNRKLSAKVKSVSFVPFAANKFDCVISVQMSEDEPPVAPGMTCTVELTVYQKKDALTVPESAVFNNDNQNHYVYLITKGQPKRQPVTIGVKSNGKAEIVAGLKSGDNILREQPKVD